MSISPKTPKISVLIPAYNAGQYVASALDSVLGQTEGDFEAIVVDDGSKDATLEVLRRYERADPRVRVISRPNTGIVGALNDAYAASRGGLLARMDADDLCLPERFERQVRYLEGRPDVVMVSTNVMVIDADGDAVAPLKGLKFGHEEIDALLLGGGWPVVHPTVMMRREAFERSGRYREGTFPNEDHDLFLRMVEQGRVEGLEEVLLKYRRHPKSVSWDPRSRAKMEETIKAAHERRGLAYTPSTDAVEEARETGVSGRAVQARLYRTWAWHALGARNLGTARKYALRAIRMEPLVRDNLRLLACLARGR